MEHILLLVEEALERDRVLPCSGNIPQSLARAERRLLASKLWVDRVGLVPLSWGGAREKEGVQVILIPEAHVYFVLRSFSLL